MTTMRRRFRNRLAVSDYRAEDPRYDTQKESATIMECAESCTPQRKNIATEDERPTGFRAHVVLAMILPWTT